jgi:large subunit ribosomal protein L17
MRHRKSGAKLNRNSSHRKAMFRNMVTSLFKYDRIRTTDAKAKELRKLADHLVTLAKRGDLHARRQALSIMREKDVVHKLFENAPQRYKTRNGGYTRIVKLGRRPGDAAPVSLIELLAADEVVKGKKPAKKKAKAPVAPAPQPAKTEPKASAAEESKADEVTAAEVDSDQGDSPDTVEVAASSDADDQAEVAAAAETDQGAKDSHEAEADGTEEKAASTEAATEAQEAPDPADKPAAADQGDNDKASKEEKA